VNLRAFKLRRKALALVATAALLTGSAVSIGVASGASSMTGIQRAQAFLAHFTQVPTKIVPTKKLTRVPPKGIKVIFLNTASSTSVYLDPGFIDAATALGWKPTIVTYSSSDPGAAVQSAIDAGYKYICSASISLSQITPQIAEMKAKHIYFFESYTADTPQFAKNGLYGEAQNPQGATIEGKIMADYMITHSQGHVNALFVSLPIYPVLVEQGTGAQAELAKNCPSCTITTLGISVPQLVAGQTPSLIVSYLQTHPTINYLYFSFDGLDGGVLSALQTAGLMKQVTIVGTQGEAPELAAMLNGQEAAWSIVPHNLVMWTIVDWMARLSVHQLTKADEADAKGTVYLANTKKLARETIALSKNNDPPGVWGGPAFLNLQFAKLWGVAK
jgi:ribose transport system substrate-binding protein